jgi:hypothetical protein
MNDSSQEIQFAFFRGRDNILDAFSSWISGLPFIFWEQFRLGLFRIVQRSPEIRGIPLDRWSLPREVYRIIQKYLGCWCFLKHVN